MTCFERRGLRFSAWVFVILLAYLSLVPGDFQARTGAPSQLEHFVAYCGTAVLFTLGYPRKVILIAVGLAAYGSVLEALQLFSPGRFANIIDVSASVAGAGSGTVASALFSRQSME